MTGRQSWNEYILRNREYVVLVDDALKQGSLLERLSLVSYECYKRQRIQWIARLNESVLRRKFKKNPTKYLQLLEHRYCSLVIPM